MDTLYSLLMLLYFFIVGAVWIFTFRTTLVKMREPGTTGLQQLLYLSGCLAAPLITLYNMFVSLAGVLIKLFAALSGVILFALALLISPFILIIYLAFLTLKKASILGERLLQSAIDFPDKIENRVTQILIRLGLVQKPPDSSNSG